ncbi:MAG: uracil-DNA glycosylase [Acidimicrobiia bacterium]|nr:uracil-DNA glycosylase [Acidimicrobiia bacterium]
MLDLAIEISECRLCPRLVEWREAVAIEKRAAFRDESYWGRPVPGFGDPSARVLVVGLAPAAHGANRTGRMFTGDRSGDWLYRALFQTGFANQPGATGPDDGLELSDAYVTSIVHCAPPANKPTTVERGTCRRWLEAEYSALARLEVIVALGGMAFDQMLRVLADRGAPLPKPRTKFGHGATLDLPGFPALLASYHPSQQNTFTGRLTEPMIRSVFAEARRLVDGR